MSKSPQTPSVERPPRRKAASNLDLREQESDDADGADQGVGSRLRPQTRAERGLRHRACAVIWDMSKLPVGNPAVMFAAVSSSKTCADLSLSCIKYTGYSWFMAEIPVDVTEDPRRPATAKMSSMILIFRSAESEPGSRWDAMARTFGAFNYVLRHGTKGKFNPYKYYAEFFKATGVTQALLEQHHVEVQVSSASPPPLAHPTPWR